MARVTIEDCLEHTEGAFALVKLAAKRARRIANGSETLLEEVWLQHILLKHNQYK